MLKKLLALVVAAALGVPALVFAAPPSQPDLSDVTGFLMAAIPTISAVAAAALALFVATKIFKWVRRAL